MSTQRVIVSKIVGAAGTTFFERLGRTSGDLRPLVSRLRSNAHVPPVVFYTEYVDSWSMGDVFAAPFAAPHTRRFLRVDAESLEVIAYRLPDGGRLERSIRLALRRKRVRERKPPETRWFLIVLLEALLACDTMPGDAVVVFVRDVTGPLIEDQEIEQSMSDVPEWLL